MFNTSTAAVPERDLVRECNLDFRNTVLPVTTFFGVEIVSGIIGNLLTVYVFMFRYKPCNFRYFVLSLALTDFISCLTTIPAEMVSQMYWYDYPVPVVCKTKVFFNQYTVCSEAASLTIIAIDRYRKVCRPFGWQVKQKPAFYACVVIHIVSALLAIPTPIFWGVRSKGIVYKGQNITVTLCEKDEKYHHTPFPLVNTTVNGSLVSVSLLVMLILYILVAKRLICGHSNIMIKKTKETEDLTGVATDTSSVGFSSEMTSQKLSVQSDTLVSAKNEQSQAVRKESNPSSLGQNKNPNALMDRARRKAWIGFCLTVIFIITTVLFWTLISVVATGILSRLNGPEKTAYFFFLRLYFINHVINPILYGILDPQFRKEMQRLKEKICCSRLTRKLTP